MPKKPTRTRSRQTPRHVEEGILVGPGGRQTAVVVEVVPYDESKVSGSTLDPFGDEIKSLADLEPWLEGVLRCVQALPFILQSDRVARAAYVHAVQAQRTLHRALAFLKRGEQPTWCDKFDSYDDAERLLLDLLAWLRRELAANAKPTGPSVESGATVPLQSLAATTPAGEKDKGEVSTSPDEILKSLPNSVRRAYLACEFAESAKGKSLEDREAHEYIREYGFSQNAGDLGELENYDVPESFETFARYVRVARNALDEQKYTPRAGRPQGPSVANANQVERRG